MDNISLGRRHVKFPLNTTWTRRPDMPFGMSSYVQSVTVQKIVYVGGGHAGYRTKDIMDIVMAYDTSLNKWRQLPPYSITEFAMTVIDEQLVLVGGKDGNGYPSDELGVWDSAHSQWTLPYSNMPTACFYPSAVVYNQWLVIAGGQLPDKKLSTVAIMDVVSKEWYRAPPIPIPWTRMKSAVVGEEWYLMGGDVDGDTDTVSVYNASLFTLVSLAITKTDTSHQHIWKRISGLEHYLSAPLCVGGSLFAVGGKSKDKKCVSIICHYLPAVQAWINVGELPHPLSSCTCIAISDKEVLVAGGFDGDHRSVKVFLGDFA